MIEHLEELGTSHDISLDPLQIGELKLNRANSRGNVPSKVLD